MDILKRDLDAHLDTDARSWLDTACTERSAGDGKKLAVLFAQLTRRVGKEPLRNTGPEAPTAVGAGQIDLGMWRTNDAAGALLLDAAPVDDETLIDLFRHGDFEERIVVLRALAVRPISAATVELLGEIQRTNTVAHFEAGGLDSDLAVRALAEGGESEGFTRDDFYRLILKAAFSDLPVSRMPGALAQADTTLSTMLQDFATEREAAGRPVWVDTYRFLGHATCPGAEARLLGGLEHGADPIRAASIESLGRLLATPAGDSLRPHLASRAAREPAPALRAALDALLA